MIPSIPPKLILRIHNSTQAGMRSSTPCAIVALLVQHGQLKMKDMRQSLKVSREAVNKSLLVLISEGIVQVTKGGVTRRGREPYTYRIAPF